MNDEVLRKIESIVEGLGYECVNVSVRTDFGRVKLQVLIDTLGGINAGDCELVSGHVSDFLDGMGDIPGLSRGRYWLEVSSPGIERPLFRLDDYRRFQGREARIRLSVPVEGRKTFTGIIQRVSDEAVTVFCDDGEKDIPFSSVKGGNLVYRFNDEKSSRKRREKKK